MSSPENPRSVEHVKKSQHARLRVAANALANMARSVVAICVLFALTPYVIHQLGAEQYGLWVLLASVIGYFELMDCGLATATVKFIGQFEGQNDEHRRNRLVSTLLATYCVIALIVAVIASTCGVFLFDILGVESQHRSVAVAVFAILAVRAALNLPLALFVGVLFGRQQICSISMVRAAFCLLYGGLAWWVLGHGGGLIEFAAVHAGVSLAEHVTLMAICFATTPNLRIRVRSIDVPLLGRVFGFSVFALMTNLSATALLRTDPILIKMCLPLSMVAVYGVSLRIAEQLLSVTKQGLNTVTPLIAQLHGAKNDQRIRSVLLMSTKWGLAVMLTIGIPAACWAKETLRLWVGPTFEAGGPIVMLLTAAMVLRVVQEACSNVLAMTGRHRMVAFVSAGNAAVNVLISLLLIQFWGAAGVAIGTLVATTLTMSLLLRVSCREHDLPFAKFWDEALRPVLRSAVFPALTCLLLHRLIPVERWSTLISMSVVSVGAMGIAFWKLGMTDAERDLILRRWGYSQSVNGAALPLATDSLRRGGDRT